jgi:hypothetical protein
MHLKDPQQTMIAPGATHDRAWCKASWSVVQGLLMRGNMAYRCRTRDNELREVPSKRIHQTSAQSGPSATSRTLLKSCRFDREADKPHQVQR